MAKMADVPLPGFQKYWAQKLASLKSKCHVMSKYPEAASVMQRVYKVLSNTEYFEYLAGCTPAKLGENLSLCCEHRKLFQSFKWEVTFRALYSMYISIM
jgi:hypothetical protein